MLSYHSGRYKDVVDIGCLSPLCVVHGAICVDHCAFQHLFVRSQRRIQMLQFTQLGLECCMCSLQCLLLCSKRSHGSLIRGHELACLGDEGLAEGCEEGVLLRVWRYRRYWM